MERVPTRQRACAVLAILLWGAAVAAAQPAPSASDAWVVAPAAGATSAPAAATLRNPTMYDVYVVSATSDAAGRVEFRDAVPGGAAQAVKVLTVPAFGFLDLTTQGTHVVLSELKRPLAVGEMVTLTFTTDGGVAFAVTAPVKAP